MDKKIKFFFLVSLLCFWSLTALGKEVVIDEEFRRIHRLAFEFANTNQFDKAFRLIKEYKETPFWHTTNAIILHEEGDLESAKKELNLVEAWVEEEHEKIKTHKDNTIYTVYVRNVYMHYNILKAVISFNQGEWAECAKRFSNVPDLVTNFKYAYGLSACYIQLNDTDNALKYMIKAFEFTKIVSPLQKEEFERRMNTAYNVSALYGRKGDKEQSLKYMEIVLEGDSKQYIPKFRKDKDFDGIRNESAFIDLIKKYQE